MSCSCDHRPKLAGKRVKCSLSAGEIKTTTHDGRSHMVVPVVMARADVVMNGGVMPVEAMLAETWNGIPVTVHHPVDGEGFISANASPDLLAKWHVGRIYNARVEGVQLKGEAWLDTAKTERVAPGLLAQLKGGQAIDVSVGFYSRDEENPGQMGDKPYQFVNRDVVPNHLALLPGDIGACSWADGCGVRSNRRLDMSKTLKDHLEAVSGTIKVALGLEKVELPQDDAGRQSMMQKLGAIFNVRARGNDDDPMQIMADLISNDKSPFVPADSDALRMMSAETLKQLRDSYLTKEVKKVKAEGKGPKANAAEEFPPEKDEEDEEKPVVNEDDEEEEDEEAMKVEKMVEAAVAKALAAQAEASKAAITAAVKAATDGILTAEQRGALALATNVAKQKREETVARVVALSTMTKDAAEKLDTPTLELFAASLHPAPHYGARIVTAAQSGDDDAAIKAMTDQDELRDKLFKGKGAETAH